MKVKDFIKWLETQDQEAVVEVIVHDAHGGYYTQGGTVSFADFDPEECEIPLFMLTRAEEQELFGAD